MQELSEWSERLLAKLRTEFAEEQARKEKWQSRRWHIELLPKQRSTCDELFRDIIAEIGCSGRDAVLDAIERYVFACFDVAVAVEFSRHTPSEFNSINGQLNSCLWWGGRCLVRGYEERKQIAKSLSAILDLFVKIFMEENKQDSE